MSQQFATGKRAFGFCDRCGQRAKLKEMKFQIVKQKVTALFVCKPCLDKDHPQLMLGTFPVYDPQALRNARPESNLVESRDTEWGWNPVGGGDSLSGTPSALTAVGYIGTVEVTT